MKKAPSPFAASPWVAGLFAAGLMAMPFDAVRGVGALGELGNELSFPLFTLAIAGALIVSLRQGQSQLAESFVIWVAAAALALIALSFFVNAPEITTGSFRERGGLQKFLTSLLVLAYGLALGWLAERVEPEQYLPLVTRYVCLGVVLAVLYLPFEYLGERGYLGGAFNQIDQIIHSRQADIINAWDGRVNEKVLYDWDPRLRSVSFEPPAFGNYTGLVWPWVWYAAMTAPAKRSLRTWALLAVFTLAVLIAGSRTGMLMLAVNAGAIACLSTVYATHRWAGEAATAARLLLPGVALLLLAGAGLYVLTSYERIVQDLILGDSVSNISRFGFQVAGFKMFLAHPLLGVGFGQFGLHVVEFLPSWIYLSPEVAPMITYPEAPWPTVYSLYGRLAAELGILGAVGWTGLWLWLAANLARQARAQAALGGQRISPHFPVILNCLGVLTSGIAADTFRTPMYWIALGLACGFIMRERVANATRRI